MHWNQLGRADFSQTVALNSWIWVSASTTLSGYCDMQMFHSPKTKHRHSSDRNSWSSQYQEDLGRNWAHSNDVIWHWWVSDVKHLRPHLHETWILFKPHTFLYESAFRPYLKPVNPLTETAYFWHRSPEWIFLGPTGFSETRYFWSQLRHKLWFGLKWKLSSSKWRTTILRTTTIIRFKLTKT